MIVIDLGCATHAQAESVEYLVERFQPRRLYGFDPVEREHRVYTIGKTRCELFPEAAWTYTGELGFSENGWGSRLDDASPHRVPCRDIAAFIGSRSTREIVLKLDIEGAEYPVLKHLVARGVDKKLTLVLVEWHDHHEVSLRCPTELWTR